MYRLYLSKAAAKPAFSFPALWVMTGLILPFFSKRPYYRIEKSGGHIVSARETAVVPRIEIVGD